MLSVAVASVATTLRELYDPVVPGAESLIALEI
jgi:hypothetical protein